MAKKKAVETDVTQEATAVEATPEVKRGRGRKSDEIEQHGVRRPSVGTATRKVWDIIEENLGPNNVIPTRGDVIEKAAAVGINNATASTQYGRFRKFHGLTEEPRSRKSTAATPVPDAVEGTPASSQHPEEVVETDGVVLSDDNEEDIIND